MQNDERNDLCVSPADEPVLEELAQQPDSSSWTKSRGRLRAWVNQPHARRRALIGAGVAAGGGLWLAPSSLKWFSSAPDIGRLCDLLSSDKRVVSFSVSGGDAIGLKIKMSDETNNTRSENFWRVSARWVGGVALAPLPGGSMAGGRSSG